MRNLKKHFGETPPSHSNPRNFLQKSAMAGLASGLALQMGKVAAVGLAPAIFGPMMNITGSSLATWWGNKVEAGSRKSEVKKNRSSLCENRAFFAVNF